MSYLDSAPVREKVNAVLGVGALHALLGVVLLIGLAVNVAPGRPPEPIIVQLQKPAEPVKADPLPADPLKMQDVQVTMVEPDVTFVEVTPATAVPLPPLTDPLAGIEERPNILPQPIDLHPVEPVRVAALPKAATVGLRTEDYPEASRRAGEEGRVSIRIGTDGAVKSCSVIASSGHSRLDAKSCQVAERRWRFSPATQNGVAVTSTQERSIVWRLDAVR
jgi:protein TonB